MKTHFINRTILCLLLGTTTTIAVAWTCEILREHNAFSERQGNGVMCLTPDEQQVAVVWQRTAGTLLIYAEETFLNPNSPFPHERPKPETEQRAAWFEIPADVRSIYNPLEGIRIDLASGWPVVALSSTPSPRAPSPINNGIEITAFNHHYRFPLKPYWPGIAFNTTLYAPLWFGLLLLTAKGRQLRRLKKNLCPTCRYSLQNLKTPGCPECGWNRPIKKEYRRTPARCLAATLGG